MMSEYRTTKIEWCHHSANPVKGLCPMACSYCYARRLYRRFKWDETIRFDASILVPQPTGQPWRWFVGSAIELFGPWVKDEWMLRIFDWVRQNPVHTFIFLTKRPSGLAKWSPFPKNAWVGVSTTGNDSRSGLEDIFADIRATVKFVSIEPLLDYSPMDFRWVNWVIVGQQTPARKSTMPRKEWVEDIAKRADADGAALFLKNNLRSLFGDDDYRHFPWAMRPDTKLRQEFPCKH